MAAVSAADLPIQAPLSLAELEKAEEYFEYRNFKLAVCHLVDCLRVDLRTKIETEVGRLESLQGRVTDLTKYQKDLTALGEMFNNFESTQHQVWSTKLDLGLPDAKPQGSSSIGKEDWSEFFIVKYGRLYNAYKSYLEILRNCLMENSDEKWNSLIEERKKELAGAFQIFSEINKTNLLEKDPLLGRIERLRASLLAQGK